MENNNNNNNRRMLIALMLSALVIIGYVFYQNKIAPQPPAQELANRTNNTQVSTNTSSMSDFTGTNAVASTEEALSTIKPVSNENLESEKYILKNDKVIAEFDSKDAVLTSYILKEHFTQDGETNVDLIERVYGNLYPFYLTFENIGNGAYQQYASLPNVIYEVEQTASNILTFQTALNIDGKDVILRKIFTLTDNDYTIVADIQIANTSDEPVNNLSYKVFVGSGLSPYRPKEIKTRYDTIGIPYLKLGSKTRTLNLNGNAKSGDMKYKLYEEPKDWIAIENRYFAFMLSTPDNNLVSEGAIYNTTADPNNKDEYHIANYIVNKSIPANQLVSDRFDAYVGPKYRTELPKYQKNYEYIIHEKFLVFNLRTITRARP